MTETEFVALVAKHATIHYQKVEKKNGWSETTTYVAYSKKPRKPRKGTVAPPTEPTINDFLREGWRVAGVSGGGDWGGFNSVHEGDTEPDFGGLDEVLYEINPGITLKQYRMLEDLVQRRYWDYQGYYGDCDLHCEKTISLKGLYERIKEIGL